MFNKFILLLLACGFSEVLGIHNITHLSVIKTCSCGLEYGGAIIQSLTKNFGFIAGAFWNDKDNVLYFMGRFGGTFNVYNPHEGTTLTVYINELRNQETSSVFPIYKRNYEFVIAANQTLYLFKLDDKDITYTLKEIMKVMDDSQLFTKGTTTRGGNIIIGTKSKDYMDASIKGKGKFYKVNVTSEKVEVIDEGFDYTGGACFDYYYEKLYLLDVNMNKIWSYNYNTLNGKTSDKKLVFDMSQHNDTVHGIITDVMADTEGRLWISMLSFQVIVFDLMIDKIIRKIPATSSGVNTLAWGGRNFDIIFAGTEKLGEDSKREPASGKLLGISGTGHRGWQHPPVRVAEDLQ